MRRTHAPPKSTESLVVLLDEVVVLTEAVDDRAASAVTRAVADSRRRWGLPRTGGGDA
jgi:hypothetical protein